MEFFTASFQTPVFQQIIADIGAAISTMPEKLYIPNREIEVLLVQRDVQAKRVYVELMDSRFPVLVQELIRIIDRALKILQP